MEGLKEVVHIAREYGDLLGAGGVRDTTEGICVATARLGIKVHIFIPHPNAEISPIRFRKVGEDLALKIRMNYSEKCSRVDEVIVKNFIDIRQPNLFFHLVDANRFRYLPESGNAVERRGVYTYTYEEARVIGRPDLYGKRYDDNFELNVLLIKSTLRSLEELQLKPDLIHCHDGHTGFLPFIAQYSRDGFASYLGDIPTLVTIYNAANRHRGEVVYDDFVRSMCGVHDYIFQGCIHQGQFDPLLAAGLSGAVINTVSENYAREFQETGRDSKAGWLGHRLAGLGIRVVGITSGVDPEKHDPREHEKVGIKASFSPLDNDFSGKTFCKLDLLEKCNLKPASEKTVLLTFVGRLVRQKGYDILGKAVRLLFQEDRDVLLVGNGSGHKDVADELKALELEFCSRIYVNTSYDPKFSNQIFAAGDFFLIPSRYEPCGLTDFIAQIYGNVPIVHGVGGLVKVIDGETGFSYRGGEMELLVCLKKAMAIYRNEANLINTIQKQAVVNVFNNFTWDKVVSRRYLPLYEQVIKKTIPVLPY